MPASICASILGLRFPWPLVILVSDVVEGPPLAAMVVWDHPLLWIRALTASAKLPLFSGMAQTFPKSLANSTPPWQTSKV